LVPPDARFPSSSAPCCCCAISARSGAGSATLRSNIRACIRGLCLENDLGNTDTRGVKTTIFNFCIVNAKAARRLLHETSWILFAVTGWNIKATHQVPWSLCVIGVRQQCPSAAYMYGAVFVLCTGDQLRHCKERKRHEEIPKSRHILTS
jgi:hypothetical protein